MANHERYIPTGIHTGARAIVERISHALRYPPTVHSRGEYQPDRIQRVTCDPLTGKRERTDSYHH